jgi:hypothetical protein
MKKSVNPTDQPVPGLRDVHEAIRICNRRMRLQQEQLADLIEKGALFTDETDALVIEIEKLQRMIRAFGG